MPAINISSDYKESVTSVKLKYKDVFDMKEFYSALHEYLMDYGWKDVEDGKDHWEIYYGERVSQGGVKEIWIWWRMFRNVDSTRMVYYLDMDFHCLGLSSTEIIRDGQKIKTNKGEVELTISANIDKVYERELKQYPLLKSFVHLFRRRVYKKDLEQRKKEFYQEIYAFQNFIKQWFKMKRYLPYEEAKNFYPSYAHPSHMKE